jgi:hypothetical protein
MPTDSPYFHDSPASEVAPIALGTYPVSGLASQHRSDLHFFDAGLFYLVCIIFPYFLIPAYKNPAVRCSHVLGRYPTHNAVIERLYYLRTVSDLRDDYAFFCSAIFLTNNHVLRYIDESSRKVPRIRCTKGSVSESLACTMSRSEILKNGQPFTEVGP